MGSCLFQICATFSGFQAKTHKTFECHVTDFGYGDTMKTWSLGVKVKNLNQKEGSFKHFLGKERLHHSWSSSLNFFGSTWGMVCVGINMIQTEYPSVSVSVSVGPPNIPSTTCKIKGTQWFNHTWAMWKAPHSHQTSVTNRGPPKNRYPSIHVQMNTRHQFQIGFGLLSLYAASILKTSPLPLPSLFIH